jgi:hypothetical protein
MNDIKLFTAEETDRLIEARIRPLKKKITELEDEMRSCADALVDMWRLYDFEDPAVVVAKAEEDTEQVAKRLRGKNE